MEYPTYIFPASYDAQAYFIPGEIKIPGKRLVKLAKIFFAVGIAIILLSYGPSIYFFISSGGIANSRALSNTNTSSKRPAKESYLPKLDTSLPLTPKLVIPSIGVDTAINEASPRDYEDALRKGVWRVPDFGTPNIQDKPVIMAAHRFGYLSWSNFFRHKNSFYNLPNLKIGDTVEIVWRQRKYTYAIYAEDEGVEIKDYAADLILYTCKDLSDSIRIFKYARLLRV